MSDQPRVGELIEFADAPGERHKIIEIKGNRALVNTGKNMVWADISPNNRTLLPAKVSWLPPYSMRGELNTELVAADLTRELAIAKAAVQATTIDFRKARREARLEAKQVRMTGGVVITRAQHEEDQRYVIEHTRDGLKLEKPQGSSLHHLIAFLKNSPEPNEEYVSLMSENFQCMVVEHDWAAAFDGVQGMNDDGDIPLPFDFTCFEFRISGIRVMVLMGLDGEGGIHGMIINGVNGRWYNWGIVKWVGGRLHLRPHSLRLGDALLLDLLPFVERQVRAACIMLDAGVATPDVQPPSEAINRQRRRAGRTELKGYHVVRLRARTHTARPVSAEAGTRHVRLHVRRGHWRHYKRADSAPTPYVDADGVARSKQWIEWMLVGDIDLGFVDKEYRL